MNSALNSALLDRTVLISTNAARRELAMELERAGARVLYWPLPDAGEPESYEAIDEALKSLFGYDWLIIQNLNAASFFLRRFHALGREISELDELRVCAVGEAAVCKLEEAKVHVDVIPDSAESQSIYDAIGIYLGGDNAIRRITFLVPTGGASFSYLQPLLEDAGGRVDLVTTYRTCLKNDSGRIHALLAGGGIDCLAFTSPAELQGFSEVFDTNDLGRFLAGVAVCCIDQSVAETARGFGLIPHIVSTAANAATLTQAIAAHFCP